MVNDKWLMVNEECGYAATNRNHLSLTIYH